MVRPHARDIIVCRVDTIPALTALWASKYKEVQTRVMIRDLGDAKRPS